MISHSELILTDKGSIYHLDMKPEDLSNIVITVGDPNRVGSVSKYFDYIESGNSHREFVWQTGFYNQKKNYSCIYRYRTR